MSKLTSEPSKRHSSRSKHESSSTKQEAIPTLNLSTDATAGMISSKNSQASLLGLPTELRLEIYALLYDRLKIHVHYRSGVKADRWTWNPCRSPSALPPLLCANPKWSEMCKEENRCTYYVGTPREPSGAWALAASSRLIRDEAHQAFFRESVVSIHPRDLAKWLDHLIYKNPRQVDSLRHVTLAGPNLWRVLSRVEFETLRTRVPNPQSLGVQCQSPVWHFVHMSDQSKVKPLEVDRNEWHIWNIVRWVQDFDPSVTIAMEAMIWREQRAPCDPKQLEQQIAYRLFREGKASGSIPGTDWTEADVEIDSVGSDDLAPCRKGTKWKQWWRGRGMMRWTTVPPFWS